MSRIFAIVDSHDKNDNANYLVNRILDGAMNLSTNIISLHYVQKMHLVLNCVGTHACRSGARCPLEDEFTDWRDEIRESDVFVIGTTFENGAISSKFENIITRFLNQAIDLKLHDKKVVIVVASRISGDKVMDEILSIRERFVNAGMIYLDELVYIDESGSFKASENSAIDNKALLIGSGLRTNWRPYSTKSS